MANLVSTTPYKIFISHKVSEHGAAVKKLKKILNRNNALKEKLQIYISPEEAPGVDWANKLYRELDEADMLVFIYCFNSPPSNNEWCVYETGYFAKKSNRENLITIVPAGVKPPSPMQSYNYVELTEEGIESLLRTIYLSRNIYPDLFDKDFKKELDQIIKDILRIFSPMQKPTALSPRIWITIKNEFIDEFKKRNIPIPQGSMICGETEAARRFGYESKENEEISLLELSEVVEVKGTLIHFWSVLSDTLQNILNKKPGPWRAPPVKVLKNEPPRIIVPAYLEKMQNGDHKFEFIVTEPPINFDYKKNYKYTMGFYNLFIVAWHFRWRIIEKYLNEIKRLNSADFKKIKEEAKILISNLKVDLNAVILDCLNREIEFPEDIIKEFYGNDKNIMAKIVDGRDGMWVKLTPKFEKACEDINLKDLIDCLLIMQNMNKTCLFLSLKFLQELVAEKLDGEIDTGMEFECIPV